MTKQELQSVLEIDRTIERLKNILADVDAAGDDSRLICRSLVGAAEYLPAEMLARIRDECMNALTHRLEEKLTALAAW